MYADFAELRRVAAAYADTILTAVQREYPNATQHVTRGPDDRPTPRELHPAFYGCFDWHSAVIMHWALVRLLRLVPGSLDSDRALTVLDAHLAPDNLAREADYFALRPGFERPYGWGWALTLADELEAWDAPRAAVFRASMAPLVRVLTQRFLKWLPAATYPVRVGLHSNSAFGLARALPLARRLADTGDRELLDAITRAAERWFRADVDYPAQLEPGGSDFLSPALAEVELMLAVLDPDAFAAWLTRFLPGLAQSRPAGLFQPAIVSDAGDGQTAHLHGLNLYRAFVYRRLAAALSVGDSRRDVLLASAGEHAQASLGAVSGSDYMVEHWLAAYAVMFLSA